MALTIDELPEFVLHNDVFGFFEMLGLNPHDIRSLVIDNQRYITVEVIARNDKGQRYLTADSKDVVAHTICIPIVD